MCRRFKLTNNRSANTTLPRVSLVSAMSSCVFLHVLKELNKLIATNKTLVTLWLESETRCRLMQTGSHERRDTRSMKQSKLRIRLRPNRPTSAQGRVRSQPRLPDSAIPVLRCDHEQAFQTEKGSLLRVSVSRERIPFYDSLSRLRKAY